MAGESNSDFYKIVPSNKETASFAFRIVKVNIAENKTKVASDLRKSSSQIIDSAEENKMEVADDLRSLSSEINDSAADLDLGDSHQQVVPEPVSISENIAEVFKCEFCQREFKNKLGLACHSKSRDMRGYCAKDYSAKGQPAMYSCKNCQKEFKSIIRVQEHAATCGASTGHSNTPIFSSLLEKKTKSKEVRSTPQGRGRKRSFQDFISTSENPPSFLDVCPIEAGFDLHCLTPRGDIYKRRRIHEQTMFRPPLDYASYEDDSSNQSSVSSGDYAASTASYDDGGVVVFHDLEVFSLATGADYKDMVSVALNF